MHEATLLGQSPSANKRLFLAVPLDASARAVMAQIQADLQKQFKHSLIMWTRPEQLHLTLHFLGSVSTAMVPQLIERLSACALPSFFHVRITEIDAFPHKKNPATIMLRTTTHPSFTGLRKRLADVLVNFAIPIDGRPFHPHITLGRVRSRCEVLRPERITVPALSVAITEVVLYESVLGGEGSRYHRLAQFRL